MHVGVDAAALVGRDEDGMPASGIGGRAAVPCCRGVGKRLPRCPLCAVFKVVEEGHGVGYLGSGEMACRRPVAGVVVGTDYTHVQVVRGAGSETGEGRVVGVGVDPVPRAEGKPFGPVFHLVADGVAGRSVPVNLRRGGSDTAVGYLYGGRGRAERQIVDKDVVDVGVAVERGDTRNGGGRLVVQGDISAAGGVSGKAHFDAPD